MPLLNPQGLFMGHPPGLAWLLSANLVSSQDLVTEVSLGTNQASGRVSPGVWACDKSLCISARQPMGTSLNLCLFRQLNRLEHFFSSLPHVSNEGRRHHRKKPFSKVHSGKEPSPVAGKYLQATAGICYENALLVVPFNPFTVSNSPLLLYSTARGKIQIIYPTPLGILTCRAL